MLIISIVHPTYPREASFLYKKNAIFIRGLQRIRNPNQHPQKAKIHCPNHQFCVRKVTTPLVIDNKMRVMQQSTRRARWSQTWVDNAREEKRKSVPLTIAVATFGYDKSLVRRRSIDCNQRGWAEGGCIKITVTYLLRSGIAVTYLLSHMGFIFLCSTPPKTKRQLVHIFRLSKSVSIVC